MRVRVYGGLAILLLAFFAWQSSDLWMGPTKPPVVNGRVFNPRVVIKAQEAIKEFPIESVDVAIQSLDPADLVLGVEINGSARAYPLSQLSGPWREIVNDRLGGVPIAATW